MAMKPIDPIEVDEEGNVVFNLSADAANADWIRAARLVEKGKTEELEELSTTPVYRYEEQSEGGEE
jgi:hypothetical protein